MEFKDTIKILRTEKGVSFADIASVVGKSEAAVRAWEYGRAKPEADTIIALSKYFDCTTDYLLGLSPYVNENEKKLESEKFKKLHAALKPLRVETRQTLLHQFTTALTNIPGDKDPNHDVGVFCLTMMLMDLGRLYNELNNFEKTKDTDSLMELLGPYYRARTSDHVRLFVSVRLKEIVDGITNLEAKNSLITILRTYFSEMNLYEPQDNEGNSNV
ncbi:MAG: helix-turn-helix transcriptional regulator [Defluviitaleaceae bacterium]|nr:helix-turn-helix transcriptional regulator [Defluviitaleaceae bacterium]